MRETAFQQPTFIIRQHLALVKHWLLGSTLLPHAFGNMSQHTINSTMLLAEKSRVRFTIGFIQLT
jgi:hypothetical protein